MQSRRSVLRTLGSSVILGLSGCLGGMSASGGEIGGGQRTVTDGLGRTVAIPETVDRIVGVGPGALRQVVYLGGADRVVGAEDMDESMLSAPYNLAYPEVGERPVIGAAGPNAGGNSERILAVDPDVIFYYGDPSRVETLQFQTNTPVVGLAIVDFLDREARKTMFETWRLVGEVLGEERRAETLIGFVTETIDDLAKRATSITADERDSAYVGAINYKGAHGIGTTRDRFAPFRWTGVSNVATGIDTDSPSVQISDEQLLAWDPETMFLSAANLGRARQDIRANPDYQSIRAIEAGRTYSMLPHATYHHNYGSILANAYFVGKTVYPNHFGDVDLESKTNEIFEAMLGAPLYAQLRDTHDAFQRLELP